jgi:phosphatidylglycerol lysyltransferase
VAAEDELRGVASRFAAAARAQGRRASFFAAAERFVVASGFDALLIGEEPTWDPRRWSRVVAESSSLRAQVRRPAAKGVRVRIADAAEIAVGGALRAQLDSIVAAWLRQKPMAPMGFLVDVRPFDFAAERICAVAEEGGRVVAFLAAVPVYARNAWLFEDLLRLPGTPNGTAEALIDAVMHEAAARGAHLVTLGLAPLSGDVPHGLAWIREVARPLYDFAGVRAFKARLRPDAWEPVYLVVPPGAWAWPAVIDALRAFAHGSFVTFGLRTFLRGPPFVVWGLIGALVAWIPVLAFVEPTRWFPRPWVQHAWVGFDIVLGVLLVALARRYRPGLATVVLGLVTADALLTLAEALAWNLPRIEGAAEVAGIVIACAGPILATLALRGMIRGREEVARRPGGRER